MNQLLLGDERGQTATEYMLIIAVVVLGAIAAAALLLPRFREASQSVADTVHDTMTNSADTSAGSITESVGGGGS
jgi:Flp pilus assembly pilin Flp